MPLIMTTKSLLNSCLEGREGRSPLVLEHDLRGGDARIKVHHAASLSGHRSHAPGSTCMLCSLGGARPPPIRSRRCASKADHAEYAKCSGTHRDIGKVTQ